MLHCSEYQGLPSDNCKLISLYGSKDWEQLTDFLRNSRWEKRYDNIFVCDGTQWELKCKGKGIRINSYGSNSFPEQFEEFLATLNRVVVGAGIKIIK
ncbi:hypothetical protein [Rufibacter tibetensis]|nr:hypothetical protein [Rufibacter tibetensis]